MTPGQKQEHKCKHKEYHYYCYTKPTKEEIDEYIRKLLRHYWNGEILRDYYTPIKTIENIISNIVEYEGVDINKAIKQIERKGKVDIRIKRSTTKEPSLFGKFIS